MAYLHAPKSDKNKLDNKTMACMINDYDEQTKAFRLYLPDKKKIAINKNVTFDEDRFSLEHSASTKPIDQPNILDFSMPPEEPMPNLEPALNLDL